MITLNKDSHPINSRFLTEFRGGIDELYITEWSPSGERVKLSDGKWHTAANISVTEMTFVAQPKRRSWFDYNHYK